jgi:SPP1 family predicted phage head-tail adaptor
MTGTINEKRKRITIERPNLIPDGQGGSKPGVPPYVLRCVVQAHERPLNGREALLAAQVTAVLSSVWEIWYRDDISVRDRIRFKARVIEIESLIDPDDTRTELHLTGSEVQA